MTKQEILDMIAKLQETANSMPDAATTESSTTETSAAKEQATDTDNEVNSDPQVAEEKETSGEDTTKVVNENDEVEEEKQIEPQTNGKITDDITPKVDVAFEQSTTATETAGVEQVLADNLDQRFATAFTQYTELKAEVDKMKVVLSEILTRIELVQEVTDKVTTVDHDSLLTESIKLLV